MDVVDACDRAAAMVDAYYESHRHSLEENYHGVWDYEVTEHMGDWLYIQNDHYWTDEAFKIELHRFVLNEINGRNYIMNPTPNQPTHIDMNYNEMKHKALANELLGALYDAANEGWDEVCQNTVECVRKALMSMDDREEALIKRIADLEAQLKEKAAA